MFSGLLTKTLRRRLTDFQSALDRFAWPSTDSNTLTARLTHTEDTTSDSFTARLHYGDKARPADRFFSRGFEDQEATELEAGIYTTVLTLGETSENISFTVEDGDTNRDVLEAFAEQVNNSSLDVQAKVFTQTGAETKVDGVNATGTILGLSVNRRANQDDLELADTRGHFLRMADLDATSAPTSGPTVKSYNLTNASPYRPSAFNSRSFDPNGETTINPGTYSVAYEIGGGSGTFDVVVSEGDTWKNILDGLANDLNGAQSRFNMQNETVDVAYYDPSMPTVKTVERYRAEVTAVDPKLNWQLSLRENNTGYTAEQLATPLLSTLGLEGTAWPGANAHLTADGTDMEAAGAFTLDQGRLSIDVQETFGRPAQTLSVREPQSVLREALTDIVSAYNDLASLLRANTDILTDGLPDLFKAPYESKQESLSEIGLESAEKDSLEFDPTTFSSAFATDREHAGILLADETRGLIPKWQKSVKETLDHKDEDFVKDPETLKKLEFSFEQALNNEYRSLIMDLSG